ncbi:sugar kinase [Sporolactobacillus terrae]|uniref:2-keto-3-deoxygluconate kinase n=1 Tax=Sporolactobacillus terrae TaxID=269673 RepID=A0A5K7WUC7_9BACL|nr:sugar kinase [Sporolactobacillus terrae]BBN97922.1 2-keto-3-deoxygluconate kinase [Sporolactobacillus terrae]
MSELITAGEPMALFIADEKGQLSTVQHFTRYLAGADVNVSVGVSRLAHTVTFLTQIGNDPFGTFFCDYLKKENIDVSAVQMSNVWPTGFMLKGLSDNGRPETFYFRKGSASSRIETNSVDKVNFSGAKILHLGGILPGLSETAYQTTLALIKKARDNQLKITFDPNLRPTIWDSEEQMIQRTNEIACLCDVVMPNIKEARMLTGETEREKMADYYLEKGVQQVIINLVDDGSYTKKKEVDQSYTEIFAPNFITENIIDRIGAGDGFVSGVVSAMLEGLSDYEVLLRGNAIGSIQMQHLGDNDGLPTREQLDAFMNQAKLNQKGEQNSV